MCFKPTAVRAGFLPPMESSPSRPVVVVDDNPDDVFFFKRSYAKTNASAPLVVARDGEEAIAALQRRLPGADAPVDGLPLIVFLDLKLPRVSGFSTLEWIRGQRAFDAVPVAVLSSSAEPRDVARGYAFGAQTYLVKHLKPDEMAAILAAVGGVKAAADLATLKLPGIERPRDRPIAT
jgi:CheY-like chemotaxis protein